MEWISVDLPKPNFKVLCLVNDMRHQWYEVLKIKNDLWVDQYGDEFEGDVMKWSYFEPPQD